MGLVFNLNMRSLEKMGPSILCTAQLSLAKLDAFAASWELKVLAGSQRLQSLNLVFGGRVKYFQ